MSPIFVVGCDRSGTTLLRLMLTSHPMVAIPPEGPFVVRLYATFGLLDYFPPSTIDRFLDAFFEIEKCAEWGLERWRLRDALCTAEPKAYSTVVSTVYEEYLRQKQPTKHIWGDKNPGYVSHIGAVASILPHARFLHIIRDGRDVAVSMRKPPFNVTSVTDAAAYWKHQVSKGILGGGEIGHKRYMEIRYEDLVKDSESSLRRICSFCGIPFDAEMLQFDEKNREQALVPAQRLAWHANTLRPVTGERVSAWKDEMTKADALHFQFLAGSMLRKYQYSVSPIPLFQRLAFTAQAVSRKAGRFARRLRCGTAS